jgi:hypothetical protein
MTYDLPQQVYLLLDGEVGPFHIGLKGSIQHHAMSD